MPDDKEQVGALSSPVEDRLACDRLAAGGTPYPLAELSPDAILCFDTRWNVTFANPAARLLTELDPGQMEGATHWRLFPDALGQPVESMLLCVMDKRKAGHAEFHRAASDLWLDVRAVPYQSGIAVFYRDISAHKRSVAFVQTTARVATWTIDLATGALVIDRGSFPVFGRPNAQIRTVADFYSLVHPDDVPRLRNRHTPDAVQTSTLASIDYRVVAPDGTILWVEGRGTTVFDESGIATQVRGMTLDITARKQEQQKLAASETRYRLKQEETERQRAEIETVYRTAPIGLALFDPVEFRYLRVNDRQAEIVGLPAGEILGRTLTEIAPIKGLRELFQQVAAGHPIKDRLIEGELPSRPGEHRFWRVSYFPVYAPDGYVQSIATASQEVTQQKKSELALIQSEKLAAVGRLATSISHEINNPLEAITNILYILRTDPTLPAAAAAYVQTAESEIARVSQIATQTLRFHRQSSNPTCVSAGEMVNAVLSLYQGRLSNSGIKVEASYRSATRVLCFENDIRQVLNNLISNAIDAMRTGGRLIVRAHDVSSAGAAGRRGPGVRITIADTGHGMSEATMARLFEPFYTTKDLNGTGLGLWISNGIVENHNGLLGVRSTDNPAQHGTVFTLFLPLKPSVATVEPSP